MIYFDNAATTRVDERVLEVMQRFFLEDYGNAGSMHSKGLVARNFLDESREKVARFLNCLSEEVVFMSGGTESVNLALKGVARVLKKKGNHIITQKTEHPAVLESCKFLESEGFEVSYLDVDSEGFVSVEDLKKEIREDTILVSIMYANNEVGTIQPIKEIARVCRKRGIFFHSDASQATNYLEMDVKNLGVDLMSLSGSKIYGPKIGVLFVRNGVPLVPLIHGGGQENNFRSGTENIPLIVGFARALEIVSELRDKEVVRLKELRDYFISELRKVPNCFVNGSLSERLPNNVNVSFPGVEGESVLLHLDNEGICASTGSACSSRDLEASHVILALGKSYEIAHGSLRFSLGRDSTKEDVDKVLEVLPGIVERLRAMSPLEVGNE